MQINKGRRCEVKGCKRSTGYRDWQCEYHQYAKYSVGMPYYSPNPMKAANKAGTTKEDGWIEDFTQETYEAI